MGGARALLTVAALLVGFQTLETAMWQAVQADLQADTADLHIQGVLTDETRAALAALPGVTRVQVVDRVGRVAVGGGIADVWAFDPAEGLPVGLSTGDPEAAAAALRQGDAALVGSRLAARLGLRPGDSLELTRAWGGSGPAPQRSLTVAGIYPDTRARVPGTDRRHDRAPRRCRCVDRAGQRDTGARGLGRRAGLVGARPGAGHHSPPPPERREPALGQFETKPTNFVRLVARLWLRPASGGASPRGGCRVALWNRADP